MRDLSGKVAVITGGAAGIGRAFAQRFAEAGMKLVLGDIEARVLDQTVGELRGSEVEVVGLPTDVTQVEDVQRLADAGLSAFGAVHVICNNAGVAPLAPLLETSLEDWRWLVEVNVMGVVHGVSIFGPLLVAQAEGHIVNTASTAGLIAPPGFGAYATTKHAVVGLTETLFYELQGTGVGVTAVCPMFVRTGIFNSERNRPASLGGAGGGGDRQELAQQVLSAEGKAPEEVAACVHQAILEDRLYAFPHDETRLLLQRRWEPVARGENPPPTRSLFD